MTDESPIGTHALMLTPSQLELLSTALYEIRYTNILTETGKHELLMIQIEVDKLLEKTDSIE
jgi:hypothetical protein